MITAAGSVPGKGGRHRTQQKELEALLVYIFTFYILPLSPKFLFLQIMFICISLFDSLFIIFSLFRFLSLSLYTGLLSTGPSHFPTQSLNFKP